MKALFMSLFVVTLLALGCEGTKNPVTEVKGKIVFNDGSMLPEGTQLMFEPTEGKVGTAVGVTKSDGSFELEHVSGRSGAEEGKYTIKLVAPKSGSEDFYDIVPEGYTEGKVLFVEIKSGMQPLDLKIPKSKKKKK